MEGRIPLLVKKMASIDIKSSRPPEAYPKGLGFQDEEDFLFCPECGSRQFYIFPTFGEVEFTYTEKGKKKKFREVVETDWDFYCAVCGKLTGGVSLYEPVEKGEERVLKKFFSKYDAKEYEAKRGREFIPFEVFEKERAKRR